MSLFRKIFGRNSLPKGLDGRTDYTSVDSIEKAIALVEKGTLVPMHPFPLEFGGVQGPLNTVYVPLSAVAAQNEIIGRLRRFGAEGLFDNFRAELRHRGESLVPTRIEMLTFLGDAPAGYNPVLDIW